MQNYFDVQLEQDALHGISALGLAHMGDGVFEVLVRSWLCVHGKVTSGNLNSGALLISSPTSVFGIMFSGVVATDFFLESAP